MLNLLVPIFKGKGDLLIQNLYWEIKLLEQALKLHENVLDGELRYLMEINKILHEFVPGKGTANAVFILRKLAEKKNKSKSKKLFFATATGSESTIT